MARRARAGVALAAAALLLAALPAGARTAAVVARGGDLWLGARQLTTGAAVDSWPAWSPDGQWIAYASSPISGGSFDIYVVAARGGASRRAAGGPGDEIAPSWSAVGKVQFQRLAPGGS